MEHQDGSITQKSVIDSIWSITAYPDWLFNGGAGYFIHRTEQPFVRAYPHDAFSVAEAREAGASEETLTELQALGTFLAWGV